MQNSSETGEDNSCCLCPNSSTSASSIAYSASLTLYFCISRQTLHQRVPSIREMYYPFCCVSLPADRVTALLMGYCSMSMFVYSVCITHQQHCACIACAFDDLTVISQFVDRALFRVLLGVSTGIQPPNRLQQKPLIQSCDRKHTQQNNKRRRLPGTTAHVCVYVCMCVPEQYY